MKILIVTHSSSFSGANKSLFALIKKMRNTHDIVVLTNDSDGELIDRLCSEDIKVIKSNYCWCVGQDRERKLKKYLKMSKDFFRYKYFKAKYGTTYSLLDEGNFDLVYTNTSTIDIGVRYAIERSIPHVWHIREFGKEDFGFTDFLSKRDRLKLLNYSKVVVISKALRKKYLSIISDDKIEVVYNGLEISCYKEQFHSIKYKKSYNLIIIGQVTEGKGQHLIIEAVNQLIKEEGFSINLYVAGNIDYEYLKKRVPTYNNKQWLHLLGHVDNLDTIRKDMDVEIICSRSEAFGRVLLEAMLLGLPVIGSSEGAIGELINDRINGLIFDYPQVTSIVESLKLILNDPVLYNNIRKNAFEFAREFTIEKTYSNLEDIFNGIIKESRKE